MLETVDLTKTMPQKEYKTKIKPLKKRLSALQHEVKAARLPVLVLFEGWGASGKGTILSDVILTLDPRNFKTKSTLPPTEDERRKPFMWRHWHSLPEAGVFGIYDRGWYQEVGYGRVEGRISDLEATSMMEAINMFERQLADDGTLVIKFFLHISQKEQKKRFDKLSAKKTTAWRVDPMDYRRNKNYDKYLRSFDEMLRRTNTEEAPWHPVPTVDYCVALAEIYQVLVDSIETALAKQKAAQKKPAPQTGTPALSAGSFTLLQMPTLAETHLGQTMEDAEYKELLAKLQKKLARLHNNVYMKKVPVIIVYEGWDAAGKGGNIRRVTAALDPRGYEVIPIASPTPPEKARHYLWRFWENLPKDGHIALFDRSWYGRVMVERVEGFATEAEWSRAYREINEFELQLADWGAIIQKFWLHIDKDEQLRRFEERQNTPEKQWKITDEDWRNREKWDAYEVAVNDMLRLTSTDFAPWAIIESQNKRYGRIKALDTLIDSIETRL